MGSLRKVSNMFVGTFAKHRKCFMDVSWSVRANIRARLQYSSLGMWSVNVKCQNNDCHFGNGRRSPAFRRQPLHPLTWSPHSHVSPVVNGTRHLFQGNATGKGGVVNSHMFDRLFSTASFKCTKNTTPVNAEQEAQKTGPNLKEIKEDVMTIPNLLTMSRIVLSPAIAYLIVTESFGLACGIFVFVGITDVLDGWIARAFPSQASACGSFLDPLADKLLVTVLFISLTMVDLIPLPLTGLILARDFLLIAAAFYIRFITLPPPRTLTKYFDVTTVSAQLKPTFISKVNTAVQLSLVGLSLGAPVFGYVDHIALQCLWYLTAGTTFASGLTYMFAKNTFETLRRSKDSSGS